MPTSQERLQNWLSSVDYEDDGTLIDEVRVALDDDLDTPSACAKIDAAVQEGRNAGPAASLLGIELITN